MTPNMFDGFGNAWTAMLVLSGVGIILGIVEVIRLAFWLGSHVRIT
jgi:hypothetical protein